MLQNEKGSQRVPSDQHLESQLYQNLKMFFLIQQYQIQVYNLTSAL